MSDTNETPPAEEVSSSELTPEQIGELEPYARLRTVSGGETLFAAGDTDAAFDRRGRRDRGLRRLRGQTPGHRPPRAA